MWFGLVKLFLDGIVCTAKLCKLCGGAALGGARNMWDWGLHQLAKEYRRKIGHAVEGDWGKPTMRMLCTHSKLNPTVAHVSIPNYTSFQRVFKVISSILTDQ
jgi:hypothetical protein